MEVSAELHAPAVLPLGKEPPRTHKQSGRDGEKRAAPVGESNSSRPGRNSVIILSYHGSSFCLKTD